MAVKKLKAHLVGFDTVGFSAEFDKEIRFMRAIRFEGERKK